MLARYAGMERVPSLTWSWSSMASWWGVLGLAHPRGQSSMPPLSRRDAHSFGREGPGGWGRRKLTVGGYSVSGPGVLWCCFFSGCCLILVCKGLGCWLRTLRRSGVEPEAVWERGMCAELGGQKMGKGSHPFKGYFLPFPSSQSHSLCFFLRFLSLSSPLSACPDLGFLC